MDRDTIFISHATPDDNDFVRWLAVQLSDRGFSVWADLLHLKGGTPFWTSIEEVLRNRAVKVIFVVSRLSVDPTRGGVRNELSVADGVRKSLSDPEFIVPVRIDDTPFDQLPIQIHQLNALDFSRDWDSALPALVGTLEMARVPREGIRANWSGAGAANTQISVDTDLASQHRTERVGSAQGVMRGDNIPWLAVLPFQDLGGNTSEDYLADGIVEDLTSSLARFRDFAVVARNSAFVYKGQVVDVREVAKALGVSYVLQGSIRRGNGRLRVATQLVDGQTRANLWAQHFDGGSEDVFDIQDGIVESVVGIVAPEILHVEIDRARRRTAGNLEAYDLYLQARHAGQRMTPAASPDFRRLGNRASHHHGLADRH